MLCTCTRARRMNENNSLHVRQIPIHHLHSEIDIDLRSRVREVG